MKETVLHAIIESHIHWLFDIVMRFQGGDRVNENIFNWCSDNSPVEIGDKYCSLYKLFTRCSWCPLNEIDHNCNGDSSKWQNFMANPCLETAQAMADVLGELALNYGVTVTPMEGE